MAFFTKKQIKLAVKSSRQDLESAYRKSESQLRDAAYRGDRKLLKKTMREHGNYEYALLLKNTPEFRNCDKKSKC